MKSVGQKVFKLQVNTQEQLAVINNKLSDIKDDLIGLTVSADKLKTEITNIQIKGSSKEMDAKRVQETFNKVIVLEDKVRSFEKMHTITQNVLSELRTKKPSQG